jgi:amino acid transporter
MDGAQVLVPILVPLSLFAMVFGLVYLKSRENLSMIEKGMNPKEFANRPAPYRNLKNGLLLLGAGIGLALAYFVTQYVLHDEENPALWFAFIGIGGGLGLISSYRIEKKELLDNGNS